MSAALHSTGTTRPSRSWVPLLAVVLVTAGLVVIASQVPPGAIRTFLKSYGWFLAGGVLVLGGIGALFVTEPEPPKLPTFGNTFTQADKTQAEVDKLVLEVRNLRRPIWTALTAFVAIVGVGFQWLRSDNAYQQAILKAERANLDLARSSLALDSLLKVRRATVDTLADQQRRLDSLRQKQDEIEGVAKSAKDIVPVVVAAIERLPAGKAREEAITAVGQLNSDVAAISKLGSEAKSVTDAASRALDRPRSATTAPPTAATGPTQVRIGVYYPRDDSAAKRVAGQAVNALGNNARTISGGTAWMDRLQIPVGIEIRHEPPELAAARRIAATLEGVGISTTLKEIQSRTPDFISVFVRPKP